MHHSLAVPSDEANWNKIIVLGNSLQGRIQINQPVMAYCESALKAMSQTHRWLSHLSSECNVKSEVLHNFTVWSADVVAKYLASGLNLHFSP